MTKKMTLVLAVPCAAVALASCTCPRAPAGAEAARAGAPLKDYPHHPVPFTAVKFTDAFWSARMATNRTVTIPYDFEMCREHNRISNFEKAAGRKPGYFIGGFTFDDTDVYKTIEAASFSLASHPDAAMEKYLDELAELIAAAQEPDGYLITARRAADPQKPHQWLGPERWSNLVISHELYNAGHFMEAAVAHYQATGKTNLLNVAIKFGDLIRRDFGPGANQRRDVPGHPEVELGLIKLYRATGNRDYLDVTKFFIDQRGHTEGRKSTGVYGQDHAPITKQDEAVGHAVRATYLYSGIADVAALTGDPDYIAAIGRIWDNVAQKKLYITGGIGSSPAGEAFGPNYDLPNRTAYNETCAAIANMFWNHRMFLLHGDARYMDVFERTLYNGFLSGISLTGNRFFYPNPLEADSHGGGSRGHERRAPWFGCACCPPNVARFIASLPGYVYAQKPGNLYVNLYVGGEGAVKVDDQAVTVRQTTEYPWDGAVKIDIEPAAPAAFAVNLRIPGWVRNQPVPSDLYAYADGQTPKWQVRVNDRPVRAKLEQGYVVIRREWQKGDRVDLSFEMPVRRVVAHKEVIANTGRAAFERGPVVYCFEETDHGFDVRLIAAGRDVRLQPRKRADLLNGVVTLEGEAVRAERNDAGQVVLKQTPIKAVPYYAWAHREVGSMAVWLSEDPEHVRLPPLATIASQAKAKASFVGSGTLAALNDQQEPANSRGPDNSHFTWWPHLGTREWVQLDFAKPAKVAKCEIYWFDDTGHGACKVPKSWRLFYRKDGEWKPVENPNEFAVKPDTYNTVIFDAVTTDGLRIEVELQPEASGGLLEWKVE